MMYKIIQNNKVVDVVSTPYFIRFQPSGHISITDKSSAQGIVGSDQETFYSFFPVSRYDVTVASIEEITLEEFNRLQSLLNSKQEICADEAVLDVARRNAIKRLSTMCKSKITSGFTIKLSDGKLHSFKLTTEDQLNLMSIESQMNSNIDSFIYHATNEPCRFYSREDMLKIIRTFRSHTLYHTTYFNTAKQYISSLIDIEKINLFKYGTDLSDFVKNSALKKILKNGGNVG